MGSGPEGGPLPIGGGMTPVLNGDGMDMKNSPANGPSTPRDDGNSSIAEYNLGGFGPPENVRTILKRVIFEFGSIY